jgi:hypothetical protein
VGPVGAYHPTQLAGPVKRSRARVTILPRPNMAPGRAGRPAGLSGLWAVEEVLSFLRVSLARRERQNRPRATPEPAAYRDARCRDQGATQAGTKGDAGRRAGPERAGFRAGATLLERQLVLAQIERQFCMGRHVYVGESREIRLAGPDVQSQLCALSLQSTAGPCPSPAVPLTTCPDCSQTTSSCARRRLAARAVRWHRRAPVVGEGRSEGRDPRVDPAVGSTPPVLLSNRQVTGIGGFARGAGDP